MRRTSWSVGDLWLIALVLFAYGYVDNGHNWSHVSRFDAIFAFVEPDGAERFTFRIDDFLVSPERGRNTGDWARNPAHDEHFYSNKAPGPMLLGVPLYAALYAGEALLGAVPESARWTGLNTWLLNLLLTVLPAAFAAVLFRRLSASELGLDPRAATLLTALLFFGTALFPYATQLWGHVSAASFGVVSLYFLCRRDRAGDVWSGFFIGLAVLSDYASAITLASFGLLLLAERRAAGALRFALGGLPALFGYVVYHRAAFGSWLAPATLFNNPRFSGAEGPFGFQLDALFGLTGSSQHGLFFFMPVLLLALPAAFVPLRGAARRLRAVALANVAGFFLMNVLFSGWHGGGCLGPRYLIPSLPFWVLLLAPLASRLRRRGPLAKLGAATALVAAAISVANMTVLAMRSPSVSRAEAAAAKRRASPGFLAEAYAGLLEGRLAPPELSPIRLGGSWRVDGGIVSSGSGLVEMPAPPSPETAASASSWLHLDRAGRTQLIVAWRGTLRMRVAGREHDLGHLDSLERRQLVVMLPRGDSELEVELAPAAPGAASFQLAAIAPDGRSVIPRATRSAPVERAIGANLGRRLGLGIVPSTLLFVAVSCFLSWCLARSARREGVRLETG